MQHSDERPPTSGRPSLLSTEQQAEADRHRILGTLESNPESTSAGAAKARRGKMVWVAAGAAVVALSAGTAVWLVSEGEKEIVMAAAPPAAVAAPLPPATPAPKAAPAEAEEVSTAAILDEAPSAPAKPAALADAKTAPDELTKMLEARAEPKTAHAAHAAPKVAAVKKPVAVAKATPAKAHEKQDAEAMAMNIEPVIAKKGAVHAKAATQSDSDVALLAALVAHSKAGQPKKATGPASQLQQCKTLASVAEADQCKARLCASTAKKESECKATNLAKASTDS
ncbi:MAG: hypothetical protein ACJ8GW_16305 [Massilia sp.]